MTIDEFVDTYEPFEKNGDIRQFDWTVSTEWLEVVKAHKEKKVCTVIEEETELLLVSGVRYVNRLFYVITKNEVPDDLSIKY
jgi:hypothetical protein